MTNWPLAGTMPTWAVSAIEFSRPFIDARPSLPRNNSTRKCRTNLFDSYQVTTSYYHLTFSEDMLLNPACSSIQRSQWPYRLADVRPLRTSLQHWFHTYIPSIFFQYSKKLHSYADFITNSASATQSLYSDGLLHNLLLTVAHTHSQIVVLQGWKP